MPTDVERKLSEQDKALAAQLGRAIGATAKDVSTTMPGAATHTPMNKEKQDGQAERYRSVTQDQDRKPKGALAARLEQQRERQPPAREQVKTQEQGRER